MNFIQSFDCFSFIKAVTTRLHKKCKKNAQPSNCELENGQNVTIQLGTYKVVFAFTSCFGAHYIDIYSQQAVTSLLYIYHIAASRSVINDNSRSVHVEASWLMNREGSLYPFTPLVTEVFQWLMFVNILYHTNSNVVLLYLWAIQG